MSINISLSKQNYKDSCKDILEKFKKLNINCRTIETISNVDNNTEYGCLVTFGQQYNSKQQIKEIWEVINKDKQYTCSHLKIDGVFDGCIYNYTKANFCN